MVLNIFPRREQPPSASGTAPTATLPEPSAAALEEPKPRARRAPRTTTRTKAAAAASAPDAVEVELPPVAEAPADAAPDAEAPRARRSRRGGRGRGAAATDGLPADEAPADQPPADAAEAPAVPAARRFTRTRAAALPEVAAIAPLADGAETVAPPAEAEAAETDETPAPERAPRHPRGERLPREERGPREERVPREDRGPREERPPREDRGGGDIRQLVRLVEQQSRQVEQLLRAQERLLQRLEGGAPAVAGGGATTGVATVRVGVFVDSSNIELATDRLGGLRIDWAKALRMLLKGRHLVRAMAYSPVHDDPGVSIETQRFVEPFLDKGFKVVTKPFRRFQDGSIKANLDIELALDVVNMLERLDVVVLVSGDGDFLQLVQEAQSKGIRVEVASVGSSTATLLRHAADEFIDLGSRLRDLRA